MTHMYLAARAEGRISYGHLGRTSLLSTMRSVNSFFDDSEAVKQFQEVAPNVVNVRCENAMLL